MLTWTFLMMQKWPMNLEALLRLQKLLPSFFFFFALKELTDQRPVCLLL